MTKKLPFGKWPFITTNLIVLFFYFAASAQPSKPNIILILGDDVGYEIPSCNGGKSYQTPNIDKMAQEGMRFTQCHATPLCSPSRVMLLTGKYNFRNYTKWGIMDRSQKTIGNMFMDAGYTTACFGKWQLNGSEQSIHTFGFDDYCVYGPAGGTGANRYKNPEIYTNGSFVPESQTLNKYGEDIFADSVMNFIESNKASPFFIYYPMVLCHKPQSPTPDDAEFAGWDPKNPSDSKFFPSMVKYMDKKIGQVIDKVKSLGLENNTVIIYVGDNGTASKITSDNDDDEITGGKASTTEAGTHVPLLVYWKGKVVAGSINNDLVDFSDFLPTLAEIANIPTPPNNGTIDGVSFAPGLLGQQGAPRDWIYYHYDPHPELPDSKLIRWAQTKMYKLYDSSQNGAFYNIINDPLEQYPIHDSLLSYPESNIKNQLKNVIDNYASLSMKIPVLSGSTASVITASSAILGSTVISNNNYPLMVRGTVYDDIPNVVTNNHTLAEGSTEVSAYTMTRTGLTPQTQYFYKGYALNDNGFGFSNEASFYALSRPVAQQPATFTATPSFDSVTLKWDNAVFPSIDANKGGYLLVYSTGVPALVTSPNGLAPGDAISNGTVISTVSISLPSLPPTTAFLDGLAGSTIYHFLLVPYTWDGKNDSTYNYLTRNAKRTTTTTLTPPDPIINSISPAYAEFAGGEFILTVYGTNFYKGLSTIYWNGSALPTNYIKSTKLTASVAASNLTVSGVFNITVVTNGSDNTSNTKTITVNGSASPLFISDKLALPDQGNVCINTTTSPGSFSLAGSGLDGSTITIGPLSGYKFSKTIEGTYSKSLFISGYGSSFSQIVYVNFTPLSSQSYNGNITVSGGAAVAINIAVTGSGINTAAQVTTSAAKNITQTSAAVAGTIASGCDVVSEYGIEYSTINGFENGTRIVSHNLIAGSFSDTLIGLSPNTQYFFKAYAITGNGTIYGPQKSFTTSQILAPVATDASGVFQKSFTANWEAVTGATSYRLDVGQGPTVVVNWTFPDNPDNAIVDTANTSNLTRQLSVTGAVNLQFKSSGATTNCASATGWDNGVNTKWWQINFDATGFSGLVVSSKQKSGSTGPADFKLQYKLGIGGIWSDVLGGSVKVDSSFKEGKLNDVLLPAACNNQPSVFLRWIVTSTTSVTNTTVQSSGKSSIDDILVMSEANLPAYDNKLVNGTSQIVTGLVPNTNYYYRVRAFSENSISINSNTVTSTTLIPLTGSVISKSDTICNGTSSGSVTVKGNGGAGTYTYSIGSGAIYTTEGTFVNLPAGSYSVKVKDATSLYINVPFTIHEFPAINITAKSGTLQCFGDSTTVTITASGGTPPYTGTGNFIQFAGNVIYTVTDANGCSAKKSITKTEPPVLKGSIISQSNVTCLGGSDGSVTVSGSGGTPNYLYKINIAGSNYQESGTFSGLSANNYKITIKDKNGCTKIIPVTITELNVSCFLSPKINKDEHSDEINKNFLNVSILPNPSETDFTLFANCNTNTTLEIKVMDIYGKTIYQTKGPANRTYHFGQNFISGLYLVQVVQGKFIRNSKIIKSEKENKIQF